MYSHHSACVHLKWHTCRQATGALARLSTCKVKSLCTVPCKDVKSVETEYLNTSFQVRDTATTNCKTCCDVLCRNAATCSSTVTYFNRGHEAVS